MNPPLPRSIVQVCYLATCVRCKQPFTVFSIPCELSPEDIVDITDLYGTPPQPGDWVTFPDVMRCPHCDVITELCADAQGRKARHQTR
jgi:hypothetical protein